MIDLAYQDCNRLNQLVRERAEEGRREQKQGIRRPAEWRTLDFDVVEGRPRLRTRFRMSSRTREPLQLALLLLMDLERGYLWRKREPGVAEGLKPRQQRVVTEALKALARVP